MAIKFIVTDLDGTLLAPDHLTVTKRTKDALQKVHNMGVKFAIATGRTRSIIDPVFEQVPFADYIIYSNGAAAFDCKKNTDLCSFTIDRETREKIVNVFEDYDVYYEIYANGTQHAGEDKAQYFKNKDLPEEFIAEYMKTINLHSNLAEFTINNEVEKINLFYHGGEHNLEIKKRIEEIPNIEFTSPVSGDLEITAKGVDKSLALKSICKAENFTESEVMTFGDADNDIGMLKFAEYSFAMENGMDIVKKNAKFVAPSNSEDGIAKMIEKYVLGEEK